GFRRPSGAWFNSYESPGFRFAAVAAPLHPGLQSVVPPGLESAPAGRFPVSRQKLASELRLKPNARVFDCPESLVGLISSESEILEVSAALEGFRNRYFIGIVQISPGRNSRGNRRHLHAQRFDEL